MENQQFSQLPSQPGISSLSGVGDLLSRSWQIYKERIWVFLGIIILPWLSILPLGLLVAGLMRLPQLLPILSVVILIFALIVIIVTLWSSVALLYAIKEREEKIGIKESFTKGWHKIISYLWISISVGFITLVGFLFFIIPGIIFAVWFSLATYVLVAEDLRGSKALSRSKQLVSGNWWKVFWRFLVLGIITVVIYIIYGLVIALIDIPYINNIAPTILMILLTPFFTTFGFLIYEDLRKIKETAST